MKTLAAILVETGRPLALDALAVPPLKPGQVLVDVAYSGVCRTQLLECGGHKGTDPYLPHCLGHEGSGVVRETGEGVRKVKPGDRVLLSWIKGSGADVPGTVYDWNGRAVNAGGITTFSRQAVISENRLTPLPQDVDLRSAALLGCAVPTGLGMVFNTLKPSPGQSLAVFGAGGIGLCAVQGAAICGCTPVIAVDVLESKLDTAMRIGATHRVNPAEEDVVRAVRAICPQGLDCAVEASGRPQVMAQALSCVRNQGGRVAVAGNAPFGESLVLDPGELNKGKHILGTWGGDNRPDRDFPRYIRLLQSGKLDLSLLAAQDYALEEINQALADLKSGRTIRPVIDMRKTAAVR